MKRISSAAFVFLALLTLAPSQAAQDSGILGMQVPPLESLAAFAPEERGIPAGSVPISRQESRSLRKAGMGERIKLPGLQQLLDPESGAEPLEFQRIKLFAPGARITVLGADGAREIQPDSRLFFMASNRSAGVGIAVNTNSGQITGFAVKGSSKMQLGGQLGIGIGLQAVEEAPDESNSCGTLQDDQYPEALQFLSDSIPESLSAAEGGQVISYQAVVAVDTDTEWMAGKGNNEATALTWITDAFLAMNVFYERDVETRLLLGDVTLRIGTDPYSVPSDRSAQLDEFGEYWRVNMASTERDFAAMLSGRSVCSGCFSGIAWLNTYCEKGFKWGQRTVGSYSFNAIGSGRSAAGIAIYLGHEIGHNMGSPHTHCYSPTVDQCYNGEGGCYSGSVSCPAGGKGTIMSYCHVSGSNGAGCGTSKSEFHPRVQTLLESQLAANSPSCIAAYEEPPPPLEDIIFGQGFESD